MLLIEERYFDSEQKIPHNHTLTFSGSAGRGEKIITIKGNLVSTATLGGQVGGWVPGIMR